VRLSRLFGSGAAARLVPPGAASGLSIGVVAAIMAFFAVLVLALALATGRLAVSWSGELAGTATLQVVAPPEVVEEQARAALEVLRTTPGVSAVRVIEVEEQRALLAPWFGADTALDALPLPLLIEVEIDRDRLEAESLVLRLRAEAPGAVFDDHSAWRAPLIVTAERLRLFALACLGLMALALAAVLSMAATAAIAANGRVIQTLRLVGARDGFIASGFTRRFARQATLGAGVGMIAGLALLATLPQASEEGFFLVGIGLVGWHWVLPLLIPPAAGAVAWIATRLATGRNLRRWS
jgi:cell division transport system permease protein